MRPLIVLLVVVWLWSDTAAAVDPPITAVAFAPDGRSVLFGSQRGIEIRSWPSGEPLAKLETRLGHVHDLAFSPAGDRLLAAGGWPAETGVIERFGWPSDDPPTRIATADDVVYRVAWSPDGKHWATAGADGICHVVDAASGQMVTRYEGHSQAVLGIDFLDDGQLVVSVGVDQTVRLWEALTGRSLRTLDNHVAGVNAIAVRRPRPGADQAVTPTVIATIGDDRTVRMWQPVIGRLVRFTRLPAVPRAVIWDSAGERLFVGCDDGHVRTLAYETLAVTMTIDGAIGRIFEIAITPSGDRILIAGERGHCDIAIPDQRSAEGSGGDG